MADIATDAITQMGSQSFLQNLGSMTSNIVNSLMLKVPDLGANAITSLVQNKLLSKYQQSSASTEPKTVTRTVVQQASAQPQVIMMQQAAADWKKYAPYVLGGGAVLGAVFYMTKKKRKR